MWGPHVSLKNTLYETANIPYPCFQFYLGNRDFTPQDIKLTLNLDKKIFTHSHLCNNLAKKNASFDMKRIKHDLAIMDGIGEVVLHVGKACQESRINALNLVKQRLKFLHGPLILENAAGQGTELGSNWEELSYVLKDTEFGLCLDTQHAFAAGLCDFATSESVHSFLDTAQEIAPVKLIHLNDSKVPFGKRVDRHESIGQGYIWRDEATLVTLLKRCNEEGISVVLETKDQRRDLKLLSQIM